MADFRPQSTLQPFVKDIFVFEDTKPRQLAFYADGFPGLVFMQTRSEAYRLHDRINLKDFYIYGQTIKPIEMVLTGPFKLIVFQLYPFALKILFGINPKKLNDECYDLRLMNEEEVNRVVRELQSSENAIGQIKIISRYVESTMTRVAKQGDSRLNSAIKIITESKGNITIKDLAEKLHMTERTLQRQFSDYVGISPKQFSKITQFQLSLTRITQDPITSLTDIGYDGGYADQPHFIRDFKKYAGRKPSSLKKKS